MGRAWAWGGGRGREGTGGRADGREGDTEVKGQMHEWETESDTDRGTNRLKLR